MDWLRRNWPDLMIGVALIAVIAGIVATLLTGGSFFQPASPTANPATADGPSVTLTTPEASDANTDVTEPSDDAGERGTTTVEPLAPEGGLADAVAPPGAPSTDVEESDAPAPADPASDAADASEEAPSTDAPATNAAASDAGDATDSEPLVLPDTGAPSDPYRVSVGAFGARENAETFAQRFRDDGYPVFLGTQGSLTIVLVGPYASRAEAERVATAIRAGDYDTDPVVYLFEPDDPTATPGASSDAAPTVTPTPSPAPTPAPTPAPSAEPAPATPSISAARSLQVGAFADEVSAEPLLENLERLGFAPTSVREDGLIKVLVGPFEGAALDDARTILDGAGLEYFNR